MSNYSIGLSNERNVSGPEYALQQSPLPVKDGVMNQWLSSMYGYVEQRVPADVSLSHTGRRIPDQSVSLFDMFRNVSETLLNTIEIKAFTLNDEILDLLPIQSAHNVASVRWSRTSFGVSFLDEYAEHGNMRGMSYETSEGEQSLTMLAIKFGINDRILETSTGEVLFRNFALAVQRSWVETRKASLIFHILQAPLDKGLYGPRDQLLLNRTRGIRGMYDRMKHRFLLLQKEAHPFHAADSEFDADFRLRQVKSARVMITDERIMRIIREHNPSYIQYWQTGRSAIKALDEAPTNTALGFRGKRIIDVEEFSLPEGAINMFKREVLMGDLAILFNRGKGDYKGYSSKMFDTQIWDTNNGKWATLRADEGIVKSRRFDAEGNPNTSFSPDWVAPRYQGNEPILFDDWLEVETPIDGANPDTPAGKRPAKYWIDVKGINDAFWLDLAKGVVTGIREREGEDKLRKYEQALREYSRIVAKIESAPVGNTPGEALYTYLEQFKPVADASTSDNRCADLALNAKLPNRGGLAAPAATVAGGFYPGLSSFANLRSLGEALQDGPDKTNIAAIITDLEDLSNTLQRRFPASFLNSPKFASSIWKNPEPVQLLLDHAVLPRRVPLFYSASGFTLGTAATAASITSADTKAATVLNTFQLVVTATGPEQTLVRFVIAAWLEHSGISKTGTAKSLNDQFIAAKIIDNKGAVVARLDEIRSKLNIVTTNPVIDVLRPKDNEKTAKALDAHVDVLVSKVENILKSVGDATDPATGISGGADAVRFPVYLSPAQHNLLLTKFTTDRAGKYVPADPVDPSLPITLQHWKEIAGAAGATTTDDTEAFARSFFDNYRHEIRTPYELAPVHHVQYTRKRKGADASTPSSVSRVVRGGAGVQSQMVTTKPIVEQLAKEMGVSRAALSNTSAGSSAFAAGFAAVNAGAQPRKSSSTSVSKYHAQDARSLGEYGACFDPDLNAVFSERALKLWTNILYRAPSQLEGLIGLLYITTEINAHKSLLYWYSRDVPLPITVWGARVLHLFAITLVSMVPGAETGAQLIGNPFAPVQSSGFAHESDFGFSIRYGVAFWKPENIDRIDAAFGAGYLGGQGTRWRDADKHHANPNGVDNESLDSIGDVLPIVVPGYVTDPDCGYPLSLTGWIGVFTSDDNSEEVPYSGMSHAIHAWGLDKTESSPLTELTSITGETQKRSDDLITPYYRAPSRCWNPALGQWLKEDDGNGPLNYDAYNSGSIRKVFNGIDMVANLLPTTRISA